MKLSKNQIFLTLFLGIIYMIYILFVISIDKLYLFAMPIGLLLIISSLYYTKETLLFIIFATPFSLNLENIDIGGIGLFLPTEPLLFLIMIYLFIKYLINSTIDIEYIKHPISISIILYLIWIFITSITSTLPIVSFKSLLSKLWYIIPVYFYLGSVFLKNKKYAYYSIYLYLLSLSIVVLITLVKHYFHGFDQEIAHWIMDPFFKDHTSYGAILAFFLPISISLIFLRKHTIEIKILLFFISIILLFGIIYSYTRAAWISIIVALVLLIILLLKIKFKYLIITSLIGIIFISINYVNIVKQLEKNETNSNKGVDEHLQSISNISTDDSNLERMNRWTSAYNMFVEKPILGFGPGTYGKKYAPYQQAIMRTRISTNFNTNGNAHSEYLTHLSETGFIGLILFLVIIIYLFYYSITLYIKTEDFDDKVFILSIILALTTYFSHALLNNYLDMDKAAIPVFFSFAIITSFDLRQIKKIM